MRLIAFLSTLLALPSSAIEIQIDYTYDTNGYFDVDERRETLEACAEFYEELLSDTLLRIDRSEFGSATWTVLVRNPQTGSDATIPNPVVPDDTLIIFAGAS